MGLINNNGVIIRESGVLLRLRQQHAVGEHLDVSLFTGAILETDLISHGCSDGFAQFLRNSTGDGGGRDATGLCAGDFSVNAPAGGKAHFGNLGAFSGTRVAGNNHNRIISNSVNNFSFFCCNGEVFRERHAWAKSQAPLFFRHGPRDLCFKGFKLCHEFLAGFLTLAVFVKGIETSINGRSISPHGQGDKRTEPFFSQ